MKVKERKDIEEKFKWDLSTLFVSDDEWLSEYAKAESTKNDICKYNGKLADEHILLECLDFECEQSSKLSNLYVYAKMKQDEDGSVVKYQDMCDKCHNLIVQVSANSSFIVPEISKMSKEKILELSQMKEFSDYSYSLSEIARNKEHSLSEKEEKILAQTSGFAKEFQNAMNMFDNVDAKFDSFINSKGEEVEMSHGIYGMMMQSENREDRKKAFESMFKCFKNSINTIARIYAGNVKATWFYAKVRGYKTCLEKALNAENVDVSVYTQLIKSVHGGLDTLNEYLEYRKDKLGLDELHMYDMHVSTVEGVAKKYTYEEAQKAVIDGLSPLGAEYRQLLESAFKNRWIDVYENKNKRSGAYSWGTYDSNPFVLLNFNGKLHDVFTIAHELGHSLHSWYSSKNQPRAKSDYEIFVAEIASTVNETLLLKSMINSTDDKTMKKYLLSYYMDMIRTTIFRQTQFAEFEVVAHEMAEKDEPMTASSLSNAYMELNKKYYYSACSDDLIKYEWARIPHFYNDFYVYKYATGLISAINIAKKISVGKEAYFEKYKKFLSAGGSMPPLDILKLAEVDLTTSEPFEVAIAEMKDTLRQLKECD